MDAGIIGGIAGSVLGTIGGVIGTYCSIKNTNGPLEKKFMIYASVVAWVSILTFITLLMILPNPYRWFLYVPYGLLMGFGIPYMNRRQQAIREQEVRHT